MRFKLANTINSRAITQEQLYHSKTAPPPQAPKKPPPPGWPHSIESSTRTHTGVYLQFSQQETRKRGQFVQTLASAMWQKIKNIQRVNKFRPHG